MPRSSRTLHILHRRRSGGELRRAESPRSGSARELRTAHTAAAAGSAQAARRGGQGTGGDARRDGPHEGSAGGSFRSPDLSPGGDRRHNTEVRWRPRRRKQREAAAAPRPPPGGGCASSLGTYGARHGLRSGKPSARVPARHRGAPPGRPPAPSQRSGGCGRGSLWCRGLWAAPRGWRQAGRVPGAASWGCGPALGQPVLRTALSCAGMGVGCRGGLEWAGQGEQGDVGKAAAWRRTMRLSPNASQVL